MNKDMIVTPAQRIKVNYLLGGMRTMMQFITYNYPCDENKCVNGKICQDMQLLRQKQSDSLLISLHNVAPPQQKYK